MEFVLTFHQPHEIFVVNDDPVRGVAPMQAWKLYMEAMAAAGVLRDAKRLEHDQPTSVSVRNGKRQVQDGPFADTKDMLGGYAVVEVESLDEALKWAERCPGSAVGSTLVWPGPPDATPVSGDAAAAAAETAARHSYGRLLAWLAWQWRDVAAAEDALADAFAAALERWPLDGVPASPDAWLLTAARRNLLMAARRQRLADDPALTVLWPGADEPAPETPALPDARLRLLFVCAHPAIEAGVHSALMLQTVLGLDAARIASAFLVKPEAMTKRLVRAKAKIRAAGLRFEEPEPQEWSERLASVLEAIYGAYTLHWGQADDAGSGQLATEAVYLAELVAAQLPGEPEALGLVALLWHCEARRSAQGDAFQPLHEQDAARWDHALIARANAALMQAATHRSAGPYQLEAAIQSAHVQGRLDSAVPWDGITRLYEQLLTLAPTVGARIAHAVALAHARDARAGLQLLDAIEADRVASHQPWWAARAHLLAMAGAHAEAAAAFGRALALTVEPRLRAWIEQRRLAEIALDDARVSSSRPAAS